MCLGAEMRLVLLSETGRSELIVRETRLSPEQLMIRVKIWNAGENFERRPPAPPGIGRKFPEPMFEKNFKLTDMSHAQFVARQQARADAEIQAKQHTKQLSANAAVLAQNLAVLRQEARHITVLATAVNELTQPSFVAQRTQQMDDFIHRPPMSGVHLHTTQLIFCLRRFIFKSVSALQ